MDIFVSLRPETGRIVERLTALANQERGAGRRPATLSETAATVLECGLRALAEDAKGKSDPYSLALVAALLGLPPPEAEPLCETTRGLRE